MTFDFTNREREVVHCLMSGFTDSQIGEQLKIANVTVKHHIARVAMKLDIEAEGDVYCKRVRIVYLWSRYIGLLNSNIWPV